MKNLITLQDNLQKYIRERKELVNYNCNRFRQGCLGHYGKRINELSIHIYNSYININQLKQKYRR